MWQRERQPCNIWITTVLGFAWLSVSTDQPPFSSKVRKRKAVWMKIDTASAQYSGRETNRHDWCEPTLDGGAKPIHSFRWCCEQSHVLWSKQWLIKYFPRDWIKTAWGQRWNHRDVFRAGHLHWSSPQYPTKWSPRLFKWEEAHGLAHAHIDVCLTLQRC